MTDLCVLPLTDNEICIRHIIVIISCLTKMRWITVVLPLALVAVGSASNENTPSVPFVIPNMWLPLETIFDETERRPWQDVEACCRPAEDKKMEKVVIGKIPQFTRFDAVSVLDVAVKAYDKGFGVWPQMNIGDRIHACERFFGKLAESRKAIVDTLMWEIGKSKADAEAEFDRTISFCKQVIAVVKSDPQFAGQWQTVGNTRAFVKRLGFGVVLCLAPFNYPINESYAAVFPALLMGNVVILKIPTTGGLAHLLTMEALAASMPPGVVNFVSGSGRATVPPMMETGKIDGLAFIGSSKAADRLIHAHPNPHRLKMFLQLEANNMGLFMEDVFKENDDLLQNSVSEAVRGALSYNGQRCTALKIFFVPEKHGQKLSQILAAEVESLPVGLPWEKHGKDEDPSKITPLPNNDRVNLMKSYIEDAVQKGARIMNKNGGTIIGGLDSTLMVPAVLYPVTPEMKVFNEEQFGPIVPIATYDESFDAVLKFAKESPYAQQISIFTQEPSDSAMLLDLFSPVYGKINLNSQCGRSPDTVPFTGRRSSAMGVMSVSDALREFSVPTVVSYKVDSSLDDGVFVEAVKKGSIFLQPVSERS